MAELLYAMGKSPSHKKITNTKPKWAMEQDKFARRMKYPNCKGTYPDCPETPNDSDCRLCPWFRKEI